MALPPKPANICTLAWEGVFAARFGIWHDTVRPVYIGQDGYPCWTGGYTYSVSSVVWLECAYSGCLWCRFLEKCFLDKLKLRYSDRPIPDETIDIRVGGEKDISQANPPRMDNCYIIFKYGKRAYLENFWLSALAGMWKRYFTSIADIEG